MQHWTLTNTPFFFAKRVDFRKSQIGSLGDDAILCDLYFVVHVFVAF
jgi:hypothetical protein